MDKDNQSFEEKNMNYVEILNDQFSDPYWKNIVRKYIETEYKNNEEYAIMILQEISADEKVLDAFCKSLVSDVGENKNLINLKFEKIHKDFPNKPILDIYHIIFMLNNKIPLVNIDEYNVTVNIENRDTLSILVYDKFILYNNKYIFDKELFEKIKELVFANKESILNISKMDMHSYRGGRQKSLGISLTENIDECVEIIGNSNNKDVNEFYDKFKNEILKILN